MHPEPADPYAALAAELALLGRRLDAMGAELLRLRAVGTAPGIEGFPGAQAGPVPVAHDRTGAPGAGGAHADLGGGPRAPWPPDPATTRPGSGGGPSARRVRSPLSGARLLAWTGVGVTLLGVVLLLALAASRGWLAPPARVVGGTLLGVALVGIGLRLHRRPQARTGAVALAATGFATLYLVVAAATALYGYLAPTPALLVALGVAAAGLATADRWQAQPLGVGVVAGAALLAPVLAGGWLLVALVLALQLAALPVVLRRHWVALVLVAAAGPVLYGAAVGAISPERPLTVTVVLAALVAGLATALPAARVLPARPVAVLVAAAPVPVLATTAAWDGRGGAAVAAAAVLALSAFAAVPGTGRALRTVAVTAAAVALFQATVVALDGSSATIALLGQAIVATALAAQVRARLPLAVGAAYGAVGVLSALGRDAPLEGLARHPSVAYSGADGVPLVVAAAVSALVLVLAVAVLVACGRVGLIRADGASAALWVPVGLVGLYGAASLVVTLALLVSDDRAGFTVGHALVTVAWTVAALVLLAHGISRPALRIAGMVLVGAAVAKLVLFDLVALDGLSRVAAFLGAGLVLLAAGARYARMVADAGEAHRGSGKPPS